MHILPDSHSRLQALETRLRQELVWLALPAKHWVPARVENGARILDVAIVGGGMLGLVSCAALRNIGIANVQIFDKAMEGREGPWVTSARMETLRTRKEAAGTALGIPALTFRAWFEAQYGAAAFEEMHLVPRLMWMDYLLWYRRVLDLPVENGSEITAINLTDGGLVELTRVRDGMSDTILARRVILATGIDGLGQPAVPSLAQSISPERMAHSYDVFDINALAGKRVAIVGAAASAMDNAAAALEAGAARVDIFIRRPTMPRVDKFTGTGSRGMTYGFLGLPDDVKWRFMAEGERFQLPAPRHSVLRVSRHDNAHFHFASPITGLRELQDHLEITTPKGTYDADFIVFATGFSVDFSARRELGTLDPHVKRWADAYTPPAELQNRGLSQMPYLGPGFEFLPRDGSPGAISNIYCFSLPAVMTHGKITSGIPSIGEGATRLAQSLARSIFVEDRDIHLQNFLDYDIPELLGDEWIEADQDISA
ncbi:NAD(P)/FAD-dependent oxidoreductase [Devosia sp. FJ2-5-3]|uniref:NAD(P)-binding domain-containing protein n=1 Tax=Devosia sp. FJ2-5-3 TaxID=2976680 RepID=UPI0023D83044|nr:NAD(P)/FAD-dependent oxidoreductase [Devosia sp. FJ2-5-3]WEJ60150.1 NAD(P)/FAD-dependent oxidoreductase [Devosia sp. FJ2-5-3]